MDIFSVFVIVFLAAAFIRVPIGFCMGIGATVATIYSGNKLGLIAPAAFGSLDSFPYLAIPAFVFAGDLMAHSGISKALIAFSQQILGRIRGNLGAVTVATSALFGAVTGSALATVTAIGSITITEMVKTGYRREYATALVSASGILGILIPPSIPGIMYAISTGVSIADVWLATILPGLLLVVAYIIFNYFSGTSGVETPPLNLSLTELLHTTPRFLVAILMPIIIFVGIYGGIFTPTEAGAVSVIYGIIAGWFIFRYLFKEKSEQGFWSIASNSAVNSAAITIILSFAGVAGRIITLSGVPKQFTQFMLGITDSPIVFLILVNLLLLFLGMIMEPNTTILLLAPLLAPAATAFGINLVHFGAIMVLNLGVGMITPPFAATLFVGCRVGNVSFNKILRPIAPFFWLAVLILMITTFWPTLSLGLLRLL